MLYSLGTIKAVNRNDRFTSKPVVTVLPIKLGMIEPNTAWSAACKSELR
jgi:hypothetical protein